MAEERDDRVNLKDGEPHPCAINALVWIKRLPIQTLMQWREAYASCSISGNRLADVCGETLRRIMDGEKVSDRYVLGLAWSMQAPETKAEMADGSETVPGDVRVRRKQGSRRKRVVESTTKVGKKSSGPKSKGKSDSKGKAALKVPKA